MSEIKVEKYTITDNFKKISILDFRIIIIQKVRIKYLNNKNLK